MLTQASNKLSLSPRRITRLLKVARSIADLEAHDALHPHHLAEALTLRSSTEGAR
jgi:magnesium chelatase family protein